MVTYCYLTYMPGNHIVSQAKVTNVVNEIGVSAVSSPILYVTFYGNFAFVGSRVLLKWRKVAVRDQAGGWKT